MKKPAFMITQTILSLFLAASVAAVGAVIYDLKTDSLHLDKVDLLAGWSTSDQKSSKSSDKNAKETSRKEAEPSAQQSSSVQESSTVKTISFRSEPADLTAQPEELIKKLKLYGYNIDYNVSGDHLIMIDTSKSNASVYCYQKSSSGYWWNIMDNNQPVTDQAFIGEGGASFVVGSNSDKTPAGIWWLGEAFYIDDKPNTTYPMFQITENTYWVTDPQSKFFNQRVDDSNEKDWSSAEHMITMSKQYQYGIVVNYNTSPAKPDQGAAIFMHCGDAPTAGCIALPEAAMKSIIEWLDKDSRVNIFITV